MSGTAPLRGATPIRTEKNIGLNVRVQFARTIAMETGFRHFHRKTGFEEEVCKAF